MKTSTIPFVIGLVALLAACGNPATEPAAVAPSIADYKIQAVGARSIAGQPYGTAVAAAVPRRQIYFDGMTHDSSTAPRLVDYKSNNASTVYTGSEAGWSASPHASIAARSDRTTGRESVVSVVFNPDTALQAGDNKGKVSVYRWNGTAQQAYAPLKGSAAEAFDLYLSGWGSLVAEANNEISAAAGDLTGDGKDEIGFCVGNRFVILDGNDLSKALFDGWATPTNAADQSYTPLTIHPSRVAAGDIRGDGSIEFVVTYGNATASTAGSYKIIGGAAPAVLDTGSLSGNGCPLTLKYANVALGDLDGDDRKEVIFAGPSDTGTATVNVVAAAWDGAKNGLSFMTAGTTLACASWDFNPLPALVAFNPDSKAAQKRDVVLAGNTILCYDGVQRKFTVGYKDLSVTTTLPSPVYALAAAADVNYDNQDELILLSSSVGAGFEIYSLGTANSFTKTTIPADVGTYMSLCAADLSGQSVVLEYLGTSVKYTDPQIIAVLASPPYYSADSANSAFGNTSTSFGTSRTTTNTEANSVTVSAGVTIGMQGDMPLWGDTLAETDKVTVSASFSYGFEKEREVTCSQTYSTMAGKDAVVYHCIPFDVYSYRVLSAPNADAVGKIMTVDFPRDPQIIQMELTLFNALPQNPLRVGSSVLKHSVGDPRSYPNFAAVSAACTPNGIYDHKGMTSAVGDGQFSTDTITVSSSNATTIGGGVSVDASVEITILGALFGVEAGFSDEFSYTVRTGSAVELTGTVPGTLSGTPFKFGVAGYNLLDTRIQQAPFMVVTYWVD